MSTTRRTMLERTGLATLGALIPGCASTPTRSLRAAAVEPPEAPAMPEYTAKPLPFDPTKMVGLSEKLLTSHHDNNYVGAVKKLAGVRAELAAVGPSTPGFVLHGLSQGELTFKHSVVLHELYFGNLVGGGSKGSATAKLLSEKFGGAAAWEERFRALGASLGGGSGWAILELDLHEKVPRMYSAADHAQGLSSGVPLLVLDMYEHSYHMDYGAAAAEYIDAFFANLHWEEIDRRTEVALRLAAASP
jgi:Fe-Mn family superoxide dismutase